MAKPNNKLVALMKREGLIPLAQAAEISGHAMSTIRNWVRAKKVRAARVGAFVFVDRASLQEVGGPTWNL